mmetsp:Transcript_10740/g.11799  ORF Transcript_10740/g.11799 Transcript_10740/m.11799 type:complete len:214 (+) Transcript_10740:50-691(+)
MTEQQNGTKELRFKVVAVGNAGSGKTSIIQRYVNNNFSKNYKATVGVDFALKVVDLEQTRVYLQLWDIAAQERYGSMTRIYYKDAVGAFVVFDMTRLNTFEAVERWKKDLESKLNSNDNIPVILIGNKIDLIKEGGVRPCITEEEIQHYASTHGYSGWFVTSAKNNENIEEALGFLVENIVKGATLPDETRGGVRLNKSAVTQEPSSRRCCSN